MNEKPLGQLFIEGAIHAAARALVYGAVLVLATFLCAGIVKQQIKEGIEYGVQSALLHTTAVLLDDEIFNEVILPKVKQNMKEAIEYTILEAKRELLAPPRGKDAPKPPKH